MNTPTSHRYSSDRVDRRERRRDELALAAALRDGRLGLVVRARVALEDLAPLVQETTPRWPRTARASGLGSAAPSSAGDPDLARLILGRHLAQAPGQPGCATSVLVPDGCRLDGALIEAVDAALKSGAVPQGRLELRFAETALHDPSTEAMLCLSALRDHGVQLAVDDFGRRIASLCTLLHLPLTVVRLDRSLTHDLDGGDGAAAWLGCITGLAHQQHMRICAVGVDDAAQRAALLDLGVDDGTGAICDAAATLAQAA